MEGITGQIFPIDLYLLMMIYSSLFVSCRDDLIHVTSSLKIQKSSFVEGFVGSGVSVDTIQHSIKLSNDSPQSLIEWIVVIECHQLSGVGILVMDELNGFGMISIVLEGILIPRNVVIMHL